MKNTHTRLLATLAIGALAGLSNISAQSSAKPTVITPPAVKDGSNWSRAPFPAARQFDDVKAPDGQAIDKTAPNTDATNVEPVIPPARVAILQPSPAPTLIGDPGLLPTGRVNVAVASSLEAATFAPTIRTASMSSRDQVLSDVQMRLKNSDKALGSFRSSTSQMSAEGRRQFNAAEDDVKAKEKALKHSIKAAKKATDATWDSARAQLAADYEAYATAVASIDAAAGTR